MAHGGNKMAAESRAGHGDKSNEGRNQKGPETPALASPETTPQDYRHPRPQQHGA